MKYCLSARQTKKYLSKADEIAVQARDYRYISDLIIEHPNKTIILDVDREHFEDDNFKNCILEYNQVEEINFVCRIYELNSFIIDFMRLNNIKFYYGYSIDSFYDIQGLIDLGVEYIRIHGALTFNIEALSRFDCKFRMVPNVAYDAYIPRKDGICGQWVRPEDVQFYENGIYVFEFEDADLEKERTLYNIYAEQKVWNGNLYFLITNLNVHADNRGLPDDFGQIRSNCGQRCMRSGTCHYCNTCFTFEKTIRKNKKELKEIIAKRKEDN